MFDTFISYRRDGGSYYAARVYDFLTFRGFKPFYDISEMREGRFDEQIKNYIKNSTNFILILSKDALVRCKNENDWVKNEIETAMANNMNIIILQEDSFIYPEDLPPSLYNIRHYQAILFDDKSFAFKLELMAQSLKIPTNSDLNKSLGNNSFKFSGEYLTQYEDFDRGRIIVRKAPATLHQLGNNVWGITSFDSQKKWKLKGKIYGKKRLAGIYYAKGYLDDGFGTFFLELNRNGFLEGYWSGYDSDNKDITTGKYIFKRCEKSIKIRNVKIDDFARVIRILDSQLGKNYISEDFLKEVIDDKKSTFCKVIEDTINHQIVGVGLYGIINYDEVKKITKGEDINVLKFTPQIGLIKTIAVDEAYKNLGLASNLITNIIDELSNKNISCFISPAWKHQGITNIENVLEKQGFIKTIEIPNYWYESSIKEQFECPQCGNPCHCSCVIYVKI